DDAGEGNEMAEGEDFIGLRASAAEAMEYAAQFSGISAHDFEGVVPGVALMYDDVEAELGGEIELLLEETGLFRFVSAVVNAGFDFFFGRALQCAGEDLRFLFFGRFDAGQIMIIEPGLADGCDAFA